MPYAGWADWYSRPAAPGFEGRRRSFAREYGDYECGSEHSTTRIAIGDGEEKQLLQAWNFLWTHNQNLGWNWLCGDCIWVGVDHFRGCSAQNPISRCGVLDYLRLPKFSYYLFRSQRDVTRTQKFSLPVIGRRVRRLLKVVVFSNCQEVELLGQRQNHSHGKNRIPGLIPNMACGIPKADPVYMAGNKNIHDDEAATAQRPLKARTAKNFSAMFDGGNCRETWCIRHFTFAPVRL